MKSAIYAGSFDMFTKGHLDILLQSCDIFDKVYLVIAVNSKKKRRYDSNGMKNLISEVVIKNDKFNQIEIVVYDGLVVDFAKEVKANYLIRGLRNINDYTYEEIISETNKEINPNIKTIYLRANNSIMSSSFVYEMIQNNKSVQKYLPYEEERLKDIKV